MEKKDILDEIEKNRAEYIKFFREIVQTDSYNPPGNEKNVAVVLQQFFEDADISCELFPLRENRANLVAFLNENTQKRNLLFNGHMDVVPAGAEGEWKNPPLSAHKKRNKYIYGRGAADMKGGLTAMAISLSILKKLDFNPSGNLILNCVCDEESGGNLGTGWSVENIFKKRQIECDFCVIGEPTGLSPLPKAIVLGEKGHLQLRLVTNGVSCHSSTPFLGENAIYMMSDIIQNLDRLDVLIKEVSPPLTQEEIKDLISVAFPKRDIFENIFNSQPLLQNVVKSLTKFTKSLNIIEGGIKENVIPDNCEAIIDFRLLPGQDPKNVIDALKQLIEDLGYPVKSEPTGKSDEVFVYIDIFHQSEGSYWENWEDSEDLNNLYDILEEVYGRTPFYFIYPACADAHYLRNSGFCPQTVLLGPGSAQTAHAIDEYIEIEDFINGIKVYALFAYDFLNNSSKS
ncbi:MAG: M20 family metallopeptidase [Promethearchaeia archaeon]